MVHTNAPKRDTNIKEPFIFLEKEKHIYMGSKNDCQSYSPGSLVITCILITSFLNEDALKGENYLPEWGNSFSLAVIQREKTLWYMYQRNKFFELKWEILVNALSLGCFIWYVDFQQTETNFLTSCLYCWTTKPIQKEIYS